MYYALKEETEQNRNSLGVSVGGFFFSSGRDLVRGMFDDDIFDDDDDFDFEIESDRASEIRFLGENSDDDDILSENSHPTQVSFTSRSVGTDQGTGAIAWFMGDVDGDRRDDVIQLWNCGMLGSLGRHRLPFPSGTIRSIPIFRCCQRQSVHHVLHCFLRPIVSRK